MLFGVINILFSCTPHLFTSGTLDPMIERGDTTRSAVVPSEPSEAAKEQKKKKALNI